MEHPMKDNILKRRKILVKYLLSKVEEEDWHGVADAAMDIREIDAVLEYIEEEEENKCE